MNWEALGAIGQTMGAQASTQFGICAHQSDEAMLAGCHDLFRCGHSSVRSRTSGFGHERS